MQRILLLHIKWALTQENLSSVFVNNKGADQPAHPRSLISASVIHILESIISGLATREILIFYLVAVSDETGLSLILLETQKTGFVATRPKIIATTYDMSTYLICTRHLL